jgi:hypothetical protein
MELAILLLSLQHLEVSSKDRISKSPLIHHFTPLMINGKIPHLTHSSCEDLEMEMRHDRVLDSLPVSDDYIPVEW